MIGIASYPKRNGLTNAHDCVLDLKQLISAHLLEIRRRRGWKRCHRLSHVCKAHFCDENGLTYVNSKIQDQSCTENFHSHFDGEIQWAASLSIRRSTQTFLEMKADAQRPSTRHQV